MYKLLLLILPLIIVITVSAQNETQRIDSLVNEYCDNSEFNGSLLVATKNGILIRKSCGYANSDLKLLNDQKTIFSIASITKTFTAALIMKLQEHGKLSVNDALNKYVPDYPGGDQITIRHLLTHTSGIPDYLRDSSFQASDQTKEKTVEQMISFFKFKPLEFEPGTKFRYSNSGYILLGFIIEKITAKSYGEALKEIIFAPLKMNSSSFGPPASYSKTAKGYQMYFKNFKSPVSPVHLSISYATGAIYSTVEDLYIWHLALEKGFLNKGSLSALYKKDVGPYGYGWFTDTLYGYRRVSHDGNIFGFKSNINRMEDGTVVIALANSNNSNAGAMVRNIINILHQKPLPKTFSQQPIISLPDSSLVEYAGAYATSADGKSRIFITKAEGCLLVKIGQQDPFKIFPISRHMFRSDAVRVEFVKNRNGRLQILMYSKGEFLGGSRINKLNSFELK